MSEPNLLVDRILRLHQLSGLQINHRREKGQDSYEFYHNHKAVKKCFTYAKAKLFAEGVGLGRALGRS
jgi:hypothetical protein